MVEVFVEFWRSLGPDGQVAAVPGLAVMMNDKELVFEVANHGARSASGRARLSR